MESQLHIGGLPHLDCERLLNIEVLQTSSRDRETVLALVVDRHPILGIPDDGPLCTDQTFWTYTSDCGLFVLHAEPKL